MEDWDLHDLNWESSDAYTTTVIGTQVVVAGQQGLSTGVVADGDTWDSFTSDTFKWELLTSNYWSGTQTEEV